MTIDVTTVRKRLAELILSKSESNERITQLDNQAKILRKKLHLDSD